MRLLAWALAFGVAFAWSTAAAAEPYAPLPKIPKNHPQKALFVTGQKRMAKTVPSKAQVEVPRYPGAVVISVTTTEGALSILTVGTKDEIDKVRAHYDEVFKDKKGWQGGTPLGNPTWWKSDKATFHPLTEEGQNTISVTLLKTSGKGFDMTITPWVRTRILISFKAKE